MMMMRGSEGEGRGVGGTFCFGFGQLAPFGWRGKEHVCVLLKILDLLAMDEFVLDFVFSFVCLW